MAKCVFKPKGKLSSRADAVAYWCPGCGHRHHVEVQKSQGIASPSWEWDLNTESPTITPSVHCVGYCHHFVRGGRIEFLSDCQHKLAGQTVPMVEVDADGYAIDRGEASA